jgi:hypothetical protein
MKTPTRFAVLALVLLLCTALSPRLARGNVLILAPDEFVEELQPLKHFKDLTGRPARLLKLSYIRQQFVGVDDAEKVKRCIAYHANYTGAQHVLLIGDIDKFPARWRWWGRWMPDDPYFTGKWTIEAGKYQQTDATAEKPFGSWLNVGPLTQYSVQVDVTRLAGEQARVLFADANRAGGTQRVELWANKLRLVLCQKTYDTVQSFAVNTPYQIKVTVGAGKVEVRVNGVLKQTQNLAAYEPLGAGIVGVGTFKGSAAFDNFKLLSATGTVLHAENFDDGVANGFTDGLNMEERGWAVSDLYYADLFKDGTSQFDDWDSNHTGSAANGLFGEIEFKLANSCPSCTINNDDIDYLPDVTVGRVPASTEAEVTRYVNKVIGYELRTTPNASWFKTAALYEGSIGGGGNQDNIETYLKSQGFTVSNRHWQGDLKDLTAAQRKAEILADLNGGVGLVNYLGHGNFDEWSCVNFNWTDVKQSLTNANMLPVMVAGACFTGRFAPLPVGEAYTDTGSNEHPGASQCETFPGVSAAPHGLQTNHDLPCIAEDLLFNAGNPAGTGGAIAYLGESRAGRHWGFQLSEYFYKAYTAGTTVGDMWKEMVKDYYWANQLDQSHQWNYGPAKWETAHMFDEPQKFVLFGDPSLQVGGAYQKALCGAAYDALMGALASYSRHRVQCDVIVPTGQRLSVQPNASLLFTAGTKLRAEDPGSGYGAQLHGGVNQPVTLLRVPPGSETPPSLNGIVIRGDVKVYGGGAIRFP